eukprot:GHVL01032572.1.p1 GENE.GHVL01032572.1~~GHVL01032572.1.p1  ORF type:complete len:226 (+),score=22.11 GHVL01032572.1:274-951(+)
MSKRYDILLRLLLVGDTGVGKTCLICRYAQDEFNDNHITTIGVDFKMKTKEINDKTVKLQIWDTAGQERFESITKQFYRRAQGVVLVFDICSRSSFESLAKWLLFVKQFSQHDTCVIMLGNKCDREDQRQVPKAVAQKFADENNLRYYETSAKHPENLDQPFLELSKQILDEQTADSEHDHSTSSSHLVDLSKSSNMSQQDSAEIQMEKGEPELHGRKGWCCSIL